MYSLFILTIPHFEIGISALKIIDLYKHLIHGRNKITNLQVSVNKFFHRFEIDFFLRLNLLIIIL